MTMVDSKITRLVDRSSRWLANFIVRYSDSYRTLKKENQQLRNAYSGRNQDYIQSQKALGAYETQTSILRQELEKQTQFSILTSMLNGVISTRAQKLEERVDELSVLSEHQKQSIRAIYENVEETNKAIIKLPGLRTTSMILVNQKGIVYGPTPRMRQKYGDYNGTDLSSVDFSKSEELIKFGDHLCHCFIYPFNVASRRDPVQHYAIVIKKASVGERLHDAIRRGDKKAVTIECKNLTDVTHAQVNSRPNS